MSIDKIIHDLKGYEGAHMHFESELRAMNRIADGVIEGVIVAIGSYRGQMDCALALHAHVPVYCIDPRTGWEGEPRVFGDRDRTFWMQNILAMGVEAKVRPIELPSLTAVAVSRDWRIGLLWIDGNHQQVARDLDAWMPYVLDGGIVALHDNNLPDVIAAVARRDDIVEIERAALTTVYRKEPLHEQYTYDNLALWVRKGPYNKDDRYVLGEVRSYDIGTEPVRTCIDVGAHIGAFTCWIKQRWPDAQIVALEPEDSGYYALLKNTDDLPDVQPLNGYVVGDKASSDDKMLFVDPVNSGSHRIVPAGDAQAIGYPGAAFDLERIMRDYEFERLSLLKIDCEGCENDVLMNTPDEVLKRINRIVGEFHTNFGSPMEPLCERLEALGFDVTWEQNPAAHATFCAINREVAEPNEELPFEYGLPVENETPKTVAKPKAKGRKR